MLIPNLSDLMASPEAADSLMSSPIFPGLNGRALVCFSHLRWDLVFQRPQHLMTRFARILPVFFVEEPAFEGEDGPYLAQYRVANNLTVLVPHVAVSTRPEDAVAAQRQLVAEFFAANHTTAPILWFYTPAALEYAANLPGAVTVYDCMDELAAFEGAAPELRLYEAELLGRADLVFTGGVSLYEAKSQRHDDVHAFPSAVETPHFGRARRTLADPADQAAIPHPRLGFYGVIDERLDRELIADIARLRPEWQLVLIGPVVKIDPASLPQAPNIHCLGRKPYAELPDYVANWDVAMMPFALNEATRFISPTKTPEYLAAGKPVVSTPILDVVRGWGMLDGVRIARGATEFVAEAEAALALSATKPDWLAEVDRELAQVSWDRTWSSMAGLIAAALRGKEEAEAVWRVSRRAPLPVVNRHIKGCEPNLSETPAR